VVADAVEGLTAEHRARIEAALPSGKVMSPEAWAELEEIVVGYRIFETRRATFPIKAERARWKRLGDAVEMAAAELRRLRRETLWTDRDPMWPNRALEALWEVHRKVETRARWHETWSAFGGRRNPNREFLWWGIMRVWTDRLGGELRLSTSTDGVPSGPLVRFFRAVVEPILGHELRGHVANIIKRERAARARAEAEKRQAGPMEF
jgi:hypothetical protein